MEETEAWNQDSNPSVQDSELVHPLSALLRDMSYACYLGLERWLGS